MFGKQPLILELWNARHHRTLETKNTGIEKQSTRASNELKKKERKEVKQLWLNCLLRLCQKAFVEGSREKTYMEARKFWLGLDFFHQFFNRTIAHFEVRFQMWPPTKKTNYNGVKSFLKKHSYFYGPDEIFSAYTNLVVSMTIWKNWSR